MPTAYLNGEYLPLEKCRIHISDLGLQRGYGIFDFFLAFDGQIRWKNDYFDRLFQSMERANFQIRLSRNDLGKICAELQQKNQLGTSAYKVIVTGGASTDMGTYEGKETFCVIHKHFTPLPESLYERGACLVTCRYKRPDPEIKTLNYFASLRLHQKIKEQEATDVLFHTDVIREASRSNFFGIKNGHIHTPDSGILKGVTRKNLLLLHHQGFHFVERPIFIDELFTFEEAFISGTTKGVLPVVKVDGKPIGKGVPGPISQALRAQFSALHPG